MLMDFMKRVDEMPSLLYNFRQAFEDALKDDDSDDDEDTASSNHHGGHVDNRSEGVSTTPTSSNNSCNEAEAIGSIEVPVIMIGRRDSKRGSLVIDARVQAELNDVHAMNISLTKQLETEQKQNSLVMMDFEASKRKILMLEAEMEQLRNPPPSTPVASSPNMLSIMSRKLSNSRSGSNWGGKTTPRSPTVVVTDEGDDEKLTVRDESEKHISERESPLRVSTIRDVRDSTESTTASFTENITTIGSDDEGGS